MKQPICALCGINQATTKDHVPPKGIFAKPRPQDTITVPACSICNNDDSDLDERFKAYLALHVAMYSKEGKQLYKSSLKGIHRKRKMKEEMIKSFKPFGRHTSVLWDSEAHDKVIERTIRGLFYHHYGWVVANNAKMTICFFNKMPPLLNEYEYQSNSIGGNNRFEYHFTKAVDSKFASIWLLQFYGSHWAGVIIQ